MITVFLKVLYQSAVLSSASSWESGRHSSKTCRHSRCKHSHPALMFRRSTATRNLDARHTEDIHCHYVITSRSSRVEIVGRLLKSTSRADRADPTRCFPTPQFRTAIINTLTDWVSRRFDRHVVYSSTLHGGDIRGGVGQSRKARGDDDGFQTALFYVIISTSVELIQREAARRSSSLCSRWLARSGELIQLGVNLSRMDVRRVKAHLPLCCRHRVETRRHPILAYFS
jgi:hypothetical protein